MTVMYSTIITSTFTIEVEAESREEAERIVDGVLDSNPTVLIVEERRPNRTLGEDILRSINDRENPLVIVRGTIHKRRTV